MRVSLGNFTAAVLLTAGLGACGLTIDATEDPDAGDQPSDASAGDSGGGTDGGSADAATSDGGAADASTDAAPTDGGLVDADAGSCADEDGDADGDGFRECAGDCDDGDAFTYPGAPEVCGDGVTNDCDSDAAPDSGCAGLGTFVSVSGANTNPGTRSAPVRDINRGIANAMTIRAGGGPAVDVYVAAGHYAEDLTVVEGISMHGGYEDTDWTRAPRTNVSVIEPTTNTGVTFGATITRATRLDGFRIDGRSVSASTAAITLLAGAEPTIAFNDIRGGDSGSRSLGVDINPGNVASSASPLLRNNLIRLGQSGAGWGESAGAAGVLARRTTIEIRRNEIGLADDADSVQFGIHLFGSPEGAVVESNVLRARGTANVAFGIRIGGGNVEILRNDLAVGTVGGTGIGIGLAGQLSRVRVHNNISFGGSGASNRSAGLTVLFEREIPTSSPDVVVHSNYLRGGEGGAGTSAGVVIGEALASEFAVGRFYNNILHPGSAELHYGFQEVDANLDPVKLYNNAFIAVGSGSGTAVLYRDEGSTNLTDETMVDSADAAHTGSLENDCSLVSPTVGGDFHLMAGSDCIDRGSGEALPSTDFEGDPRVMGAAPDIGPDEAG